MADFIFFYGTLLPEHAPLEIRGALAALRPDGAGSVRGTLFDFGAHPGAVLSESAEGRVFGQVFELPDDPGVLAKLDEYEGYDPAATESEWFVRKRVVVSMEDGRTLPCWVYEYSGSTGGLTVIVSGRFACREMKEE